jgi:protein involved in polysaccharide export with SLBB domain
VVRAVIVSLLLLTQQENLLLSQKHEVELLELRARLREHEAQLGLGTVTVVGAVRKPGVINFRHDMTIVQAIGKAGGSKENADLEKSVQIMRHDPQGEAGNLSITVTVDPLTVARNKAPEVYLQVGDVVYVPAK